MIGYEREIEEMLYGFRMKTSAFVKSCEKKFEREIFEFMCNNRTTSVYAWFTYTLGEHGFEEKHEIYKESDKEKAFNDSKNKGGNVTLYDFSFIALIDDDEFDRRFSRKFLESGDYDIVREWRKAVKNAK